MWSYANCLFIHPRYYFYYKNLLESGDEASQVVLFRVIVTKLWKNKRNAVSKWTIKMPADTIGNSISSFLNKTDQVSQKYRNVQLESDAGDRFGRSSSVARATSVARQFEPTSSTFMRAGSVARGFETSSRDPFYSQISKPPSVTRQAQTMLSPHSSVLETINQSHLLSPSQSKNVIRENKNGNAKFRSLEVD